jgi:hypothetical protein
VRHPERQRPTDKHLCRTRLRNECLSEIVEVDGVLESGRVDREVWAKRVRAEAGVAKEFTNLRRWAGVGWRIRIRGSPAAVPTQPFRRAPDDLSGGGRS